jgi:hypothetical protein
MRGPYFDHILTSMTLALMLAAPLGASGQDSNEPGGGKFLSSLAFATALLAVASSEASANFVCQAVGARSVGYGRAYFVADAKWQALVRCERYSGICIISYCVPAY